MSRPDAVALQTARNSGWLGDNIQDSGFNFEIDLHIGAGSYVCGEETAMLESLEGKAGITGEVQVISYATTNTLIIKANPKDYEIVEGIQLLAETEGIFTETAGGVVISGLRKLARSGAIKPDDVTVAYITGNGLKTQEAVESLINPVYTSPSYTDFTESMKAWEKGNGHG